MIVITDENLAPYAPDGFKIVIPAGESSKSRACKAWIEDQMLDAGFGRDAEICAFGGGVVLDLAGFVAATYCRGISWTAIPTSLLAMVDASIGGKVGINTQHGKNLIGAFYPPKKIILDFKYLDTLPEKEWKNGEAEIIKCGLIADPTILEAPRSIRSIKRAIEIKKEIVAKDPKEKGLRRILNFGHTIGHAIEKVTNYEVSHGVAVANGMRIASRLSPLSFSEIEQIEACLQHFEEIPLCDEMLDVICLDKKAVQGHPRFVLLEKIGAVCPFDGEYCTVIEKEKLRCMLQKAV